MTPPALAVLAVASPGITEEQVAHVLPKSGLWPARALLVLDSGALQTLWLLQAAPNHVGHDLVRSSPPREGSPFGLVYDGKLTAALQVAADRHSLTPGVLALWDGVSNYVAHHLRDCLNLRAEVEVWLCEPDQEPRSLSLANVRERLDALCSSSDDRAVLGAWPQGGAT